MKLIYAVSIIGLVILLYFVGSRPEAHIHKVVPSFEKDKNETEEARKDAHLVTEDIWLGNWSASIDPEFLKKNGIVGVLCLNNKLKTQADLDMYRGLGIEYKYFYLWDDPRETLPLAESFEWIKNRKGPILVHCTAGVSRSASVVIYYIMKTQSKKYHEAFEMVQQKRKIIYPNDGFQKQLIDANP